MWGPTDDEMRSVGCVIVVASGIIAGVVFALGIAVGVAL